MPGRGMRSPNSQPVVVGIVVPDLLEGVLGEPCGAASELAAALAFLEEVVCVRSGSVKAITGTYRGNAVTHYLNPSTGLNVITDPAGKFVSGWKLSAGQLQNVLSHGGL